MRMASSADPTRTLDAQISLPSRMAMGAIRAYRALGSPIFGGHCRFQPTCSSYGLGAFQKYGFLKATGKTAWRIMRCNPFNRGDRYDAP
jgi:uncharacterized protein